MICTSRARFASHCPHVRALLASIFTLGRRACLVATFALAFFAATALAGSFTAGDLAILQMDETDANSPATIIELSPSIAGQTPTNLISIPGAGANAMRFSASATSTAYVASTNDRTLLTFTGANNTVDNTANVNTLNPRVVGTLDAAGIFAIQTSYTGSSGQQTRGATSVNNTTWFIADQGGFYTNGATTPSPTGNWRGVKSFGGTVYVFTASTGAAPVGTVSAPSGGSVVGLPGLANGTSNHQDFYLISSGSNGASYDVLYVLVTSNATSGTINKFSLVGGTWAANGSYATSFGGFGLAAAKSGSGAALYVTTGTGATTGNSVIKVTDTAGYNSAMSVTTSNNVTLYTATGKIIKGIDFAPIAAVAQPDLTVSVSAPASAMVGTNFDYTITASNTGAADAALVAVDFTVPAGLNVQSTAGTGFTINTVGQVVHFTGGAINAGANATLTVTVQTAVGATYTAPAGAAVIDPSNTITESNEANNSSTAAAATNVLQAPAITTQPNPSQTIASGTTANLTVAASGFLAPTFQWYEGLSGDTSHPVGGATSANFTTPALTATTSYWARATNASGSADSDTAVVNISAANANLSNLVLSTGTLNPAFASATIGYTATVPNATTSLTVTPTTADTMATVKVSNVAVASGSPSDPIGLNVGANIISVAVTAQDSLTVKTYTITVTRLSNDASLSSLVLSAGTLTPAFDAGTVNYSASVPNTTSTINITPTVTHPAATVTVNGTPATSGAPTAVPLNPGPNTIGVAVTAEDLSTRTYTVVVTRVASTNANLSNLTTSTGLLSNGSSAPTASLGFLAAVTDYRSYLANDTASITVTPTLADAGATVTVNGNPVASATPSASINLNEGANTITVLVTAADSLTTKTYTIHTFRSAPALTTGAIAFTGFDADANDDIAFVALTTIPENSAIFFSDNEWNGSAIGSGGAFLDFNESEMVWIAPPGGVAAGTIVTISNISAATSTNVGSVAFSDNSNRGFSTTADAVYVFQGSTHVPSVFLTGITTDTAASFANTGLTAGSTEVVLASSSDGARYKGPRIGQTTFAGYLSLLGNVAANWDDIGNGDGASFLPFDTTAFLAGPLAQVSINDVSVSEGDSGTATLTFTVTRGNNLGDFTLHFATADGTGANKATVADNDYQDTTGTVTFTAGGALTQPVSILVNGDTNVEHDETFFVNLSNLVSTSGNATISDAQGVGTIVNDDAFAPVFTTHPASPTIATGTSVTLSVVVDAFPAATYQWYAGMSGDISNPVSGATSANFTTPVLLANANYWVRASNAQGSADSNTAVITLAYATPYSSGNINILNPNTAAWNPAGVNVSGTQFVNLGLQGVGRFPATAKDPVTGESIGSISDMQITGWHKNGDGSYSGTMNTLPDRGYNAGTIFSNYAARINRFDITFTPYTAVAPTTDQHQIAMTFAGSTRFTYDHDSNPATAPVFTTGLLANGGVSLFGTTVPVALGNSTESDGTVTNRLTLDSEGLILDSRLGKAGTGWVGDEYGAYIYHFDSSKQIDGVVNLPAALIPHATSGGPISFIDVPANVDGRRVNQGMEGIAQSPDGTKLFGLMQSATMQDSGSGNQGRFNTRLLVYDISSSDTPADPVAQYVIQLPRIDDTGLTTNGNSVSRTGAQSSIIALNDHQLLILARDGNGRGVPGSASPVFKSILLADLSTATNIDGIYDNAGNAVAPAGVLAPTVTPISWTEALNMIGKLDSTMAEVEKFGLNLQGGNGDINTICEKWESLGLVSAKDPANPNDYFLFIGNDNDFLSGTGKYLDANGVLQDYDAGLENDTLVLAFRVRFTSPEILVQQPAGTDVENGGTFDFGSVAPGGSSTKTFTVKNTGSAALAISNLAVTGGNAADFVVNAGGNSFSVGPNASITFDVTYNAPATGSSATTLVISNNDFNDGAYAIPLTGKANHAPTLTLPTSPIVVDAEDASGAHVAFEVTASDIEDGVLTPMVTPPTGSLFGIGDTTVNVSATDSAGATTTGSFVVHVNEFVAPPVNPTLTTVYSKGGAVPHAGSVDEPRIQANATWTGFGPPAINDGGHVAYVGRWKAPAAAPLKAQSGIGIFVDGTLLVKTTEPVPGITGAVFKTFKDPVIDAGGHVAFLATIANVTGGTAVTPTSDTVVVSNGRTGALEVLAREGSVAPDSNGATYKVFSNVSIQGDTVGGTLFTASLLQGSGTPGAAAANDTGAWWLPAGASAVTKLVREGDPGFESGEIIKSFVILKPVAGSPAQGRGQVDGASALLQVTLFKTGPVKQAVVLATPGNLANVTEAGDLIGSASLTATWAKIGLPSSGVDGSVLSLLGSLKTGPGGVPSANAMGIFQSVDSGATYEPIARAGFAPPGVSGGATFSVFKDPVNSPAGSDVAFIGTSKIGKVGSAGIWWQAEGSPLSLVALQGQEPACGPVGAKWKTFSSLALPGHLGPVFTAMLEKGPNGTAGPGGVTGADDLGLYAVDASGVLHELLRENQTLEGQTVKTFNVLKALAGSAGSTRSFNNGGSIVVLVTFVGGNTAIVRIDIPTGS